MLVSSPDRKRATVLALAVAAVVFGGLAAASSADAACYSSTPSATSFVDAPADGSLAPEITTITAQLDGACAVTVDPGVTAPLIEGDGVFVYLDVAGNPATGSSVFQGADVAVGSLGVTGIDPPPLVGRFDAASDSFSFDDAPVAAAVGYGGFSATLDQLGVPTSPTTLAARTATIWSGISYDYFDFAPEPAAAPFPFAVAFDTTPPPPPPPPVAPAPPAPPAQPQVPVAPAAPTITPVSTTPVATCKVPSVKRLRLAAARHAIRHAGCHAGEVERVYSASVRSGRVIRSLPKGGTRWSEPVDLVVSKGRRPRHKRAHASATSAAGYRGLVEIAARRLDAEATG
jgi:hypothetical protein